MPALIQINDATRQAEVGQLNQWINEVNQEIANLQRQLGGLRGQLEQQRKDFEARLVALEEEVF